MDEIIQAKKDYENCLKGRDDKIQAQSDRIKELEGWIRENVHPQNRRGMHDKLNILTPKR